VGWHWRASRQWHPWATVAALVFAVALPAAAQTYEIVSLGTLSEWEDSWSMAYGLNDNGQVSGYYTEPGGTFGNIMHPFLWENGVMHDLGILPRHENAWAKDVNINGHAVGTSSVCCQPAEYQAVLWNDDGLVELLAPHGVTRSFASDINDAGQIVGQLIDGDGHGYGYVWQAGVITDIGTLDCGGGSSSPNAVNNVGQVVGCAGCDEDGDGQRDVNHPFLWQDGQLVELGVGDGDYGDAYDINDAGDVVGMIGFGDWARRAVLWRDGEIVDLGTPRPAEPRDWVFAVAINNSGQIVGRWDTYTAEVGGEVPFLWQDGVNTDLNDLLSAEDASSWVLTRASDINDLGQITGWGIYQGQRRAFLMTPAGGRTVNVTFTSNIRGVTITADEIGPISVPQTLEACIGDTYTNLTAQHYLSRTEGPHRFDSWRRVEAYDEGGTAQWVELSAHASLDLDLTEDMTVQSPVTGELGIAIQAHYVPAVRRKAIDEASVLRE